MSNEQHYSHPVAPPHVAKQHDAPKPKDSRSDGQLSADIERTRDEIAQTLDALEYKLDVTARGRELLDTGKHQVVRAWDDNPLLVGGIAVGAVVAIIGAIVGAVALGRRDSY